MTGTPAAAAKPSAQDRNPRGTLVDTAEIPGGGLLHLYRHEERFEIMFGDEQLMGSWDSGSEKALATLVCERLGTRAERVLIGGLGMGFTLNAALDAFPPRVQIVVAELVPKVVEWAAGPLAHIFGESLSNPRVTLAIRDVHDVIDQEREGFDAILLDVDNGPDGLINLANERLYCNWGLRAAHAALRPGGVLAVWSAYQDQAFADRLQRNGFEVEEHTVYFEPGVEEQPHTIWIAARTEPTAPADAA